ncbi:hypothetical protein [Carnobacterium iners]|uniref:hypothetical protein n=1 Tax=Carnobacterium iners TaxID=1073423 RepID=UPI001177EA0A|nr:hypothetical protein [Carnobacterium iners]
MKFPYTKRCESTKIHHLRRVEFPYTKRCESTKITPNTKDARVPKYRVRVSLYQKRVPLKEVSLYQKMREYQNIKVWEKSFLIPKMRE